MVSTELNQRAVNLLKSPGQDLFVTDSVLQRNDRSSWPISIAQLSGCSFRVLRLHSQQEDVIRARVERKKVIGRAHFDASWHSFRYQLQPFLPNRLHVRASTDEDNVLPRP